MATRNLAVLRYAVLSTLLVLAYSFFPPKLFALTDPPLTDGSQFFEKIVQDSQLWSDYSCITEMHNFKPDKTTISSSRFFYRKGPEIRIEVMGGGFRDGSIIVKKKDGSIRAKGGFFMGGIEMNLDPDSRMLILPSGVNAAHADLPELFLSIKQDLSKGFAIKVSSGPITEPSIPQKVFMLEVLDSAQQLNRRIYLSEDKLPVRWDSFKGGKMITSTFFKNIRINAGLKDDKFQL